MRFSCLHVQTNLLLLEPSDLGLDLSPLAVNLGIMRLSSLHLGTSSVEALHGDPVARICARGKRPACPMRMRVSSLDVNVPVVEVLLPRPILCRARHLSTERSRTRWHPPGLVPRPARRVGVRPGAERFEQSCRASACARCDAHQQCGACDNGGSQATSVALLVPRHLPSLPFIHAHCHREGSYSRRFSGKTNSDV